MKNSYLSNHKYTNAWDSFDSGQGQERETDIEMQQNNLRAGAKKKSKSDIL